MCLNIPTWTQARVSPLSTAASEISGELTSASIKAIQHFLRAISNQRNTVSLLNI